MSFHFFDKKINIISIFFVRRYFVSSKKEKRNSLLNSTETNLKKTLFIQLYKIQSSYFDKKAEVFNSSIAIHKRKQLFKLNWASDTLRIKN